MLFLGDFIPPLNFLVNLFACPQFRSPVNLCPCTLVTKYLSIGNYCAFIHNSSHTKRQRESHREEMVKVKKGLLYI